MKSLLLWLARTPALKMGLTFPLTLLMITVCSSMSDPIRSYAALGDSYAAGDGAGSSQWLPSLDPTCGRFTDAYPNQVADFLDIDRHWYSSKFRNKACGGATTTTVLLKQLPHIVGADLITIQVGGNEVDFFPLLNECIQQWHPLSTCDRELIRARGLIESSSFVASFDRMVKAAARLKHQKARLFVLGYARFFDAESEQCNHVSFSVINPANVLSNKLRRTMNSLVDLLNDVIQGSAEANNAVYIDIDELFEGHRFCQNGTTEPRPDNSDTWFFRAARAQSGMALPNNFDYHSVSSFFDLTRTFHPTTEGHEAITHKIELVIADLRRLD